MRPAHPCMPCTMYHACHAPYMPCAHTYAREARCLQVEPGARRCTCTCGMAHNHAREAPHAAPYVPCTTMRHACTHHACEAPHVTRRGVLGAEDDLGRPGGVDVWGVDVWRCEEVWGGGRRWRWKECVRAERVCAVLGAEDGLGRPGGVRRCGCGGEWREERE
jgi:hypothetical protein